MPNWCDNVITIKGSHEDIKTIKDHLHGKIIVDDLATGEKSTHENVFDFNQLITMPEEIERTTSPTKIVDTQKEADELNEKDKDTIFNHGRVVAITKAQSELRGEMYGMTTTWEWGEDKSFSAGKQVKVPIVNWHDWATEYWGTKWNSSDARVIDIPNDSLVYEFQSPWGPPIAIYERLVKDFPNLHIHWYMGGVEMEQEGTLQCNKCLHWQLRLYEEVN